MEKKYCPICGEEIIFRYSVPSRYYQITDHGNFERVDNNFDDNPMFDAICSGDSEHDFGPSTELEEWSLEVATRFADLNILEVM